MKTKHTLNAYEKIIDLPKTLNLILLIMIYSVIPVVLALHFSGGSTNALIALILLEVFSLFLLWANNRNYHQEAGFGAFLLLTLFLAYNMIINNGLYDISLLVFPTLIVFSSFLLGIRYVVPITTITSVLLALIYQLSMLGFITPFDGRISTLQEDFLTLLAAMLITGFLVHITMTVIGQNVQQVIQSETHLRHVYENTLNGWAKALELRDHETEGHSQRVTTLALKLAKKMGVPKEEFKSIRWGALLHDIGKMGIPDLILLKPGPLTPEEFELIKEHPLIAEKLLSNIPYLASAMPIPQYHHEKWDGSGYPDGLKGEEIPLTARLFAIIDVWDALISKRPYKPAWPQEEAIAYLRKSAGNHFDPAVVNAFLEIVE